MASPLEVAFLLANLRAVGLMPDSDFQRLNPGLIELIRRSVYRESGAGEPQIGLAQFFDESAGETDAPSYDEWSSRVGDEELWRHVISMFLALKREVDGHSENETSLSQFLLPDDEHELGAIESANASIRHDEISSLFEEEDLPIYSLEFQRPGIFDGLEVRSYEMSRGVSREALADLSRKVNALEREIADLRGQSRRSDFRDDHATPPIHSQNAEDERAKKSRIAELQRDLQRELRSAELHASKGETFNAGSARGRAARIESKLRALGA